MYIKNNVIQPSDTVKMKEENTNAEFKNSCNQSLNTNKGIVKKIEFVNEKVEQKDDFDTNEIISNYISDPIATNDVNKIDNHRHFKYRSYV